MRFFSRLSFCAVFLLASLMSPISVQAQEETGFFTCPPCGCSLDGEKFEAEGSCSDCGMALIFRSHEIKQLTEVESIPSERQSLNVAILVFPGVQIIDFTAPYEVFGQAGFNVYTVGENKNTLNTAMGLDVTPEHDLGSAPKPDILVIPGGGVRPTRDNETVLNWIRKQNDPSQTILTVCNGAFILAETGMLDGLEATTFYGLIPSLRNDAPKVTVVSDRRYVDNGNIITTAGLSSGIDGSLYVVGRLLGKARAQQIALNMEYNWLDDVNYARANFADRLLLQQTVTSSRHLPYLDAPGTQWRVLETQGDAKHWRVRWHVAGETTPTELLGLFSRKLEEDAGWRRVGATRSGNAEMGTWNFDDEDKQAWVGEITITPANDGHTVELRIRRDTTTG